jgi:hypothetical protein
VENNTVHSKRTMHGVINKLRAIISLKAFNRKTELSTSKSNKINNVLMYLGLALKWVRPAIVCKIIQKH